MAHIIYGGQAYHLDNDKVDSLRRKLKQTLSRGESLSLNVKDAATGKRATLFVSPGVAIAVNSWDVDDAQPRPR